MNARGKQQHALGTIAPRKKKINTETDKPITIISPYAAVAKGCRCLFRSTALGCA